jgi:S-adenosylmethionine hydrolase
MRVIVTLTTDFCTVDGYVGAMKGVILSRAPGAYVVDITHEIPPQDVWAGARALQTSTTTFPAGTIHLAVVDPGVGTCRKPLFLQAKGQMWIGPDNGVLSLATRGEVTRGWVLDRPEFFRLPVSPTFHGRDIFAAVAGHLAAGVKPEICASPLHSWVELHEPLPIHTGNQVLGRILYADRFGNLITNLPQEMIGDVGSWRLWVNQLELGSLRTTYEDVPEGTLLGYIGSSGYLELAIRQGNAAAEFEDMKTVEIRLCPKS